MEVRDQSGVTLIELLIVMAILAAVTAVSFPSITAGLAGVRLTSAAGNTASFLTSAMNAVERHEEPAAIVITPRENKLEVFTAASGEKAKAELAMPAGIVVEGDESRRIVLFPGGAFPRVRVILHNETGSRRSIEVDPVTAVPEIKKIEANQIEANRP